MPEVTARHKKTLERGIDLSPQRSTSKALSPSETKVRSNGLLAEVRDLILETRQQTARTVNAGLTLLYWQVGDRIQREILLEKRAEYGAEIVLTLSAQLELEFGRGFGERVFGKSQKS
ncbi:MAG: DUF1016 N-terminal domain-containing protein [Thermoanaerobaculia bacterium]